MVELYIDNKAIELKDDTNFQFNYTTGDIFNIAMLQVSYSNSFQVPLSPNNVKTMQGLGLVGNNSPIPYRKTSVNVKYDGFDIVNNGWLDVQETSDSYRLAIREGVLDFWKEIENKTIGNDLDISSLDHNKRMDVFISSLTNNEDYTYITADFGGKMQLPDNTINIDYLIPVVKLSYFWDKIFDTFGYTYSGSIFSNPDFTDACITYPKAPDLDDAIEILFSRSFKGNTVDSSPVQLGQSGTYGFPNSYNWDYKEIGFGNWGFTAPHTGKYRLKFRPAGYVQYGRSDLVVYYFNVYRGTNILRSFWSQYGTIDFSDYFIDLNLVEGEEITFEITTPNLGTPQSLRILSLEVEVYNLSLGNIDFTDAFSEFPIKDFVKEIIWRYGLTPVYDAYTKNIHFYTVDEKVNFNNYVNWTDKYVKREKEIYLYGNNYAQTNIFAHKYNDEAETFRNGQLTIANENLPSSKIIAQSKIYAADRRIRSYNIASGSFDSVLFPVWQSEVREVIENDQTVQKIEYKGLSGRFYIMKIQQVNEQGKFKSEVLDSNVETTPHYYVSNLNNTHYNDLVAKYYPTYERILNDFKMHTIELAMSLPDVLQLDFTKLYYFEQEASFYILNKLNWQDGNKCKGEFIRINR